MRNVPAVEAAHRACEVLFDADVRVLRDRVILRLTRGSGVPCVLEHRLIRGDGTVFSQALALPDSATFKEFAAADPYGDHLHAQYESTGRILREQVGRGMVQRQILRDELDALGEIGTIASSTSEAEVITIASRVLSQLGGRSYTYRWLQIDDRSGAVVAQRCLVGCHPAWVHTYIKRQWYRKDPFVEYARRNGAPALGRNIASLGDDHWGRDVAGSFGFRSAVVCPAHPPSGSVIGLLQVGNELPAIQGEQILWQHRVLFRALAEEMLDWGIARQRSEEVSRVDLEPRELIALRLLRAGRTACHVAESLGVSERTAYGIFRKINDKLGVSHIARAVEMAAERGLIE